MKVQQSAFKSRPNLKSRIARLRKIHAKPKIALVRAPIVSTFKALNNEATPAIALAYLMGSLLDQGYEPIMIDAVGEGLNNYWPIEDIPGFQCQGIKFDEILARIPKDTSIIGFSAMFSGEWPVVRKLINYIRSHFPNAIVLAGGEHATALPQFILRDCPALDICIRGEGESALLELLTLLSTTQDITGASSVSFLDANGNYVENLVRSRIRSVDEIPWPHWPEGYLEKFWASGKSYGPQTGRDMPMMLSRGCPYQCTFCSNPQMWTTRYYLRDIDDVINEVKFYIDRYNITAVQLYDLTAIVKKDWAIAFLKRLIKEEIDVKWSFPSGTRSEALDEEVLNLLKRVGCNYLVYAPESGSKNMLQKLKKKIKLDVITQSMILAKKIGLVCRANIILGFPGETRWDLYKTLWYGMKLSARGVDEVQPNLYSPYPGSELFDQLVATNQIELNDEYFLSLTSINSDLSKIKPLTFNEYMGPVELAIYRVVFTMANYGLGYLFFPSRTIRTFKNIAGHEFATTVFEHRLKDVFRRGKLNTH